MRNLAAIAASCLVLVTSVHAQPAPHPAPSSPAQTPAPAAPFDAAARRAIVADVAKAMRDEYVEPDKGARAAAKIEQALATGDYDKLQTPAAFADRLTADLDGVAHDKHLRVSAAGQEPPALEPPPISEAGVVRADRLAGGVGYVEIVDFPEPHAFKPALDRAMASLADTKTLVIDMRRNTGGSPQGVAYLVSYFVDANKPVHVMDLLWRKAGTADYSTMQTFTSPTPTSYVGKPIFVLTSARTFSGGEEFCYDMQNLKLATLVGETTGGGANPGGGRELGVGLVMFLPSGKARSPVTGANWEGVGVTPTIAAPATEALRVVLAKLGPVPASGDIAVLSQASLFKLRTTPTPGAEAALRRLIESNAVGQPDYSQLTPGFTEIVRSHLNNIQPILAGLGPIQSITFRAPGAMGGDSFEVTFAKGAEFWSVMFAPDGKIAGALFGPVPAATPATVTKG
jgi:Peptidase family S41/N-terminal domain of Peptidase_S41 in eukaryotic IRBP